MYCPKCGESLKERGVFLCERGQMELSQFMAERLYSGFVSKTEEPEELPLYEGRLPLRRPVVLSRCGVLMNEETPGAVSVPSAGGISESIRVNR